MATSPQPAASVDPGNAPVQFTPEMQMANMLGLCEAQMESALGESDRAVDALIKAFSCLVEATRSVSSMTDNLPSDVKKTISNDLNEQVAAIYKQMNAAVMAFQFYDKLTQRLGHVRYSLSTLALFVCDRSQMNQPDQWMRLLNTLRRLYRTEEELKIFHMIMDGGEGVPSVAALLSSTPEETKPGEVELF